MMADLREGSAMAFALGRGGFTGGGELERGREKGEMEGVWLELYRRAGLWCRRKGSGRIDYLPYGCGRGG